MSFKNTIANYIPKEYQALSKTSGIINFPTYGLIKFTGNDSLDLLNRLSTNNIENLQINQGAQTVITSNKGKILDVLQVFRTENSLIILTSLNNESKVIEHIEFFTFSEDVVVKKITENKFVYKISGPQSQSLLNKLFTGLQSHISPFTILEASINNHCFKIIRNDFMRYPGFVIIGNICDQKILTDTLVNIAENFDFEFVNPEAINAVRIDQGIPEFGKELTEKYNPLEGNLINSISFNKGCYVGQEVIARLNTYKKVQNSLCLIQFKALEISKAPPNNLYLKGKPFGVLTSLSKNDDNESYLGLAYISKKSTDLFTLKNFQAELSSKETIHISYIKPADPV
ncbi:MAG: hypothetical protein FI687_04575 [SAR202 cluster bacterium]|nr:hypothetical protein [SAR202 cluster bacterium]|tara:strand:- start:10955 stop:11983 length:1029 start_codon:yes stop_codon:yes gene_type:complete